MIPRPDFWVLLRADAHEIEHALAEPNDFESPQIIEGAAKVLVHLMKGGPVALGDGGSYVLIAHRPADEKP